MKTDLTAPVEAVAEYLFNQGRERASGLLPPKVAAQLRTWDQIEPIEKSQWRQQALPIAQAAIEAIPEPSGPGSNVWLQALMGGPDAPV